MGIFIINKVKICWKQLGDFFNSLVAYLAGLLAGKSGLWIIVSLNLLLIVCGISLLLFAEEIGPLLGKESWDSLIYYNEQFLFLGRLLLFSAVICDLWFYLFKKKVPLPENIILCAQIFGCALLFDSYCRRTFWYDTIALAVHLKQFSLKELLLPGYPNPYLQMGPPGFLAFSKLLGEFFGFNKWSLALPALLFSLCSLCAFKKLAGKVLTPWGCAAAMWIFALNPGVWIYAGEFKQYCCDIFFTILILAFAEDYTQDEKKYWKKLAFSGVIALLFSHAMFFVMPMTGVALLIHYFTVKKDKSLFFIGAIWFIAVLAMACYTKLMMPSGMYIHEHHIKGFAPLPDSLENIKWYWESFTSLFIAPWGMAWKIPFLFVFPLAGMVIGIKKLLPKQLTLIATFVGMLLLLYIASFMQQYSLASGVPFPKGRLILFTIPPAILIFCGCLKCKKTVILAVPVILSVFLHCCTAMIPFGKSEAAVKDLLNCRNDGDQIFVSDGVVKLAVLLYTPEHIVAKVNIFNLNEFYKVLPTAEYVHVMIADLPPEKLPVPDGYRLKRLKTFAFSSVMTFQRVKNPACGGIDE